MRNPGGLAVLFPKKVSQTDRRNRLALPTRLMGYVWPPEVVHRRLKSVRKFRVVDIYGQSWIFDGHLRWGNRYPKPEVRGPGWRDFIRNKGLRVGDKLIFYRPPPNGPAPPPVVDAVNDPPPVLVVSVMREIKLGGKPIIGHVAPVPPMNNN